MPTIQLIVGLGNPGPEYEQTRHNAGTWFVGAAADQQQQSLRLDKKFSGLLSRTTFRGNSCYLLIPATYMNHSGRAVKAVASYYKIPPESILVAHDELDFSPGVVKLKQGGGHAGHNGLRDIISQLGSKNFLRLRIGIGHPGQSDLVSDYVLSRPSRGDHQAINEAIDKALYALPTIAAGDIQKAMQELHQA